jgi:hypothetical protein
MTISNPRARADRRLALSQVLGGLASDPSRERVSVGDLLAALGDRAIGALLFVFSVPNVMPTPPGVSTVLGAPLLFLSAQLMLGRKPWLPRIIASRSMARDDVEGVLRRVVPWLERAERLLRPRVIGLALPPMENLVGLICLLLAVILVLPIPLGNIPPALAISLMALGILERDGLWVLAGLAVALASVLVVWGVILAIIKAAIYMVGGMLN